ncbi:HNH endonuclease [Micromonospora tulbaghiae]|uniref:HNH endonuclease n=1 Tax=Micromonospora tulbaghiae TaxID=479978 RepID=UPI0013C48ABF|nr:HNH endonuclease signature motif containing protein [Micromonospora tulbaghiae]
MRGLADPGATGQRAKRQRAEALGVWVQLLSWVSGERSDGFLTEDILDLFGWDEANARLLRARYGRAPLLHRRDDGETCDCMTGRAWVADYDYLIHDYLDRNPSRSENDVHKAKAKELKDSKLKAAVRARDRDICRYCGNLAPFSDRVSDAGLTYDHVDPEVADGMSNLVVACRGCNRRKSKRTPEAAGMTLRPAPGERPPAPEPASDLSSDLGHDLGPNVGHDSGSDPGPPTGTAPATSSNAPVCLQSSATISAPTQVASSPGTGRAGSGTAPYTGPPRPGEPTVHRIGPPTTPRGPIHGSPYLRGTRPLPEHHAGRPPQPDEEGHR